VNNDDDLNGDGRVGDLLDREIGLTLETIRRLGQSATDVRVAVAAWTAGNIAFPSGGEILDVGAGRFNQLFIDPSSISDVAELEVSLRSLSHRQQGLATHSGATLFRDFVIGPGNNYDQSLQTLLEVLDVAPEADQTQVYYFTDGLFFGNEDLPAMAETIDEVGSRGIQFRAIQAVGPSQVRAICDANAAPDWCLSVDSGSEFVEVVQEISDGIDAVAGSAADIVIGDSPDKLDDLVLPPVLVAGVTVNDVAVESFDDDGNFFTRVTIEPGENPFVIRAVDSLGNETEQSVTLIGTAGPGAEQFHEVTAMTHIDFDTASLNRSESVLRTSARVVNPSGNRLRGPVHVVINRVEPPSITLISDHELDSEGRPVITLSDEIPLGGLASFESSASFELEFANAQSQRFEVDYSILAAGNSEPSWASSPTTATAVGNEYRYDAVAFDPNGDDLVYSVTQGPNSLTVDPATGNVRWTPTSDQLGNHTVELSVHDGWGGVADQTFQLSVSETIANRPPLVQSSPRTQVSVGQAYVYQVEASDLDGDTLSYSLAASPAGLTVNASTGLLEWSTPSPGAHDVVIEVSDGASIASQAFVLTVGDSAANPTSPVVLSTPTIVAAVEQAYVYVPFAQDPDGDALQYSVITAPQGLTLDAASGRIDWLPLAEQVGNHTVAFKVEDGRGGVATQLFSVEVLDESTNLPPAFISLPAVLATAGETYHDAAIAVDPNSDPLDFQIVNGPAGMVIDEQSGQIEFTPSSDQLGLHRVTLRVSDGHAVGLQSFDLDVRIGPNERPEFESIPGSVATVGRTYFYAAVANDPNDEVRYQVIAGPAGFAIDPDSGLASMTPGATQLGSHSIVIGASDERGAVAQQSFLLEVVEDTEAPIVSVILSTSVAQPNEPVTVSVAAVDDVAIDSISLTIDGVEFSLDSVNTATFESPEGGLFDVIATATDLSGNVGTASTRLRVIDPSDVTPPQLTLDSPMPGQQIGYLTDIVGSVLADDLEFFRVDFAPADLIDADDIGQPNPAWVTLAESNVAGSAMALATFDPTVLNDGSYLIRVHAQDFSGNADVQAIPVEVVAPAKLGPFSVEYTDLTIPLAGLSLEVTRRYSTLDAQEQGDFGYGWKMGFDDPDIRETAPADETNSIGLFGATPFTFGTRVYLTNPDGERIGFSFEPERTASFFGDAYTPKFVADVGVEDRLEVDPITLSQSSDGSFQAFLIGFPYNPDQYRLVRPNGDVYEYDQRVGLEKVTDISGNELIISTDGITHSSGASIDFVRDPLGRISEIIDPAGHSISYQYDPPEE
ncbi:MAG: putative Ig domain-containing protein, partial [Planctomycetota bacterium]